MYGGHSRNGHATFDPNTFVLSIICTVGTQEKMFAIPEFISAHSTLSWMTKYERTVGPKRIWFIFPLFL